MDKGAESHDRSMPAWGGGVGTMPHIGDETGGWRSVGAQQRKGVFEGAQTQALFGFANTVRWRYVGLLLRPAEV